MLKVITGLLVLSTLGSAEGSQKPPPTSLQTQPPRYKCGVKDGNYCFRGNLESPYIIRCHKGIGTVGNCNDRFGEKGSTENTNPCYQPDPEKYDAACSTKRGVVYPENGRRPFLRPGHPKHPPDRDPPNGAGPNREPPSRDQFGRPFPGSRLGQGGFPEHERPPFGSGNNNGNSNQNNNQNSNQNGNQNDGGPPDSRLPGSGPSGGGPPGGGPFGGGLPGDGPGRNQNGNQNQNQNNNANSSVNNNINNNINNNANTDQNQNTNANQNANANGNNNGGPPVQKDLGQEDGDDTDTDGVDDLGDDDQGVGLGGDGGVEKRSERDTAHVPKAAGTRLGSKSCGIVVAVAVVVALV